MSATTEQSCINALKLAKERLGHEPTKQEYMRLDIYPSESTICRVCGSWNQAKRKADMATTLEDRQQAQEKSFKEYSRDDCIHAVKYADEQSEYKNLTASIYRDEKLQWHPSATVVQNRLGGFPEIRETIL